MCVLASCAADPAPRGLGVVVRDGATEQPLAGVAVRAEVAAHNHPFSVASMLGATGPHTTEGRTDQSGRAELMYTPGRAVRICAVAPGYDPLIDIVEDPGSGRVELRGQSPRGAPTLLVIVQPRDTDSHSDTKVSSSR